MSREEFEARIYQNWAHHFRGGGSCAPTTVALMTDRTATPTTTIRIGARRVNMAQPLPNYAVDGTAGSYPHFAHKAECTSGYQFHPESPEFLNIIEVPLWRLICPGSCPTQTW